MVGNCLLRRCGRCICRRSFCGFVDSAGSTVVRRRACFLAKPIHVSTARVRPARRYRLRRLVSAAAGCVRSCRRCWSAIDGALALQATGSALAVSGATVLALLGLWHGAFGLVAIDATQVSYRPQRSSLARNIALAALPKTNCSSAAAGAAATLLLLMQGAEPGRHQHRSLRRLASTLWACTH